MGGVYEGVYVAPKPAILPRSLDCRTMCICPPAGGGQGCGDSASPGSTASSLIRSYPNLEVGGRSAEPFTTSCCAALSGRAEALHVTLPSSVADAHAIEGLVGLHEEPRRQLLMPSNGWNTTCCCRNVASGLEDCQLLTILGLLATALPWDRTITWELSSCTEKLRWERHCGALLDEFASYWGKEDILAPQILKIDEIVAAAVPLPPSSTGGLQPAITHPRVVLPWLAPKRRNTSIWRPVYSIDCCEAFDCTSPQRDSNHPPVADLRGFSQPPIRRLRFGPASSTAAFNVWVPTKGHGGHY
ncbi:hypothetical protein ECG_07235 [Echinococcus granulosus]|uniref:Uncharacterized protein n=1 Tax=Echinococcus granulosus TaxID=6210 RepID=A0A068WP64_ECHGR|nr:hypothetical protein ECG_07235 [Echinococcus granulosus]CDS21899.1 hypothetical protein EgrG_002022300 [Echinococcus granulosus]